MENNKPKIYTFNCDRYNGQFGSESFRVQQPVCTGCNRALVSEIKYAKIEFEFEQYNGEDLIFSNACLIVSQKLLEALEAQNVKGYAPIRVKNKRSKYFEGDFKSIGTFIYLAIFPPEVKNIPIAYSFADKCSECGLVKGDFSTLDMDLMFRESTENQQHLQVYHNSWNENDVFGFLDHAEIGVTQKFLDVIKDFNCPDTIIIPAEWI